MKEIKLIKSTFYKEIDTKRKLANFILESDILSMSNECKKFEDNFSKFQQRKYSVFVSSGSMANLILIQSLLNIGKLKKGDNIGVSAITWATNIMPLIQLGLNPILIDCEIETLNISKETIINGTKGVGIKGLFLTNVLGFSGNMEEIKEYCNNNNILLFEDNCESLGSEYRNIKLGNFGVAATFSFFVGHHMSTIEGGMICTDDEELHDYLLMARAHGWSRNLSNEMIYSLIQKNSIDEFHNRYTFYDLGYNGRPTEISGFIGNTQIKFIDEIIQKRQRNFNNFQEATSLNKDIIPLKIENMNIVSNFAFPVIFKTKQLFNHYKEIFIDNNIEIRPIISGNMEGQPFYKKYVKDKKGKCEYAQIVHEQGFYFGNNPELTQNEIKFICKLLKHAVK